MKSYIICATPRTGSTLLCDLLASTRVAGDPDSFFMADPDSVWAERWGLPAPDGLDAREHATASLAAAITAGRGETAIFGLRLMQDSLGRLVAMLGATYPALGSDRARLEAAFGEVLYIHLRREDRIAQAVSLVKAEQTGLWHVAPDGREVERLAPHRAPAYDFERISATVRHLERQEAAWRTWFADQGIGPLVISYEEIAEAPSEAVLKVLAALGVERVPSGDVRPGVARLSDATSRDWIRRYRLEAGMDS